MTTLVAEVAGIIKIFPGSLTIELRKIKSERLGSFEGWPGEGVSFTYDLESMLACDSCRIHGTGVRNATLEFAFQKAKKILGHGLGTLGGM